jgi:hypothetical protein
VEPQESSKELDNRYSKVPRAPRVGKVEYDLDTLIQACHLATIDQAKRRRIHSVRCRRIWDRVDTLTAKL